MKGDQIPNTINTNNKGKETHSKLGGEQVKEYSDQLDVVKSAGPNELKELGEAISELLAINFESSWRMGEVPEDWQWKNIVPSFNKGNKEDLRNCQPVSLEKYRNKLNNQLVST